MSSNPIPERLEWHQNPDHNSTLLCEASLQIYDFLITWVLDSIWWHMSIPRLLQHCAAKGCRRGSSRCEMVTLVLRVTGDIRSRARSSRTPLLPTADYLALFNLLASPLHNLAADDHPGAADNTEQFPRSQH